MSGLRELELPGLGGHRGQSKRKTAGIGFSERLFYRATWRGNRPQQRSCESRRAWGREWFPSRREFIVHGKGSSGGMLRDGGSDRESLSDPWQCGQAGGPRSGMEPRDCFPAPSDASFPPRPAPLEICKA